MKEPKPIPPTDAGASSNDALEKREPVKETVCVTIGEFQANISRTVEFARDVEVIVTRHGLPSFAVVPIAQAGPLYQTSSRGEDFWCQLEGRKNRAQALDKSADQKGGRHG